MAKTKSRLAVEAHTIDEVEYEVIVDSEGGHYFGRWVCKANGHTGGSSAQCDSIPEAVRAAKVNLGTFHQHTFKAKQ